MLLHKNSIHLLQQLGWIPLRGCCVCCWSFVQVKTLLWFSVTVSCNYRFYWLFSSVLSGWIQCQPLQLQVPLCQWGGSSCQCNPLAIDWCPRHQRWSTERGGSSVLWVNRHWPYPSTSVLVHLPVQKVDIHVFPNGFVSHHYMADLPSWCLFRCTKHPVWHHIHHVWIKSSGMVQFSKGPLEMCYGQLVGADKRDFRDVKKMRFHWWTTERWMAPSFFMNHLVKHSQFA